MFEKLGRALDELAHGIKEEFTVTTIEPKTDQIVIPYRETTKGQLRLEIGVGRLEVAPGGEPLVEGTVRYNVKEWTPDIFTQNGTVTIRQGRRWPLPTQWNGVQSDWQLMLGTTHPYQLAVQRGVGTSSLSLGGIPLTECNIDHGTGALKVYFDGPNQQPMSQLSIKSGTGQVMVDNLLNANVEQVNLDCGVGECILHITGEALQRTMRVRLMLATGSAKLKVKAGLAVCVSVSRALGDVQIQGGFSMSSDHRYMTPDYTLGSNPAVEIEIIAALGAVHLETTA